MLSADLARGKYEGDGVELPAPLLASEVIYAGALVVKRANGFACVRAATATDSFFGVAQKYTAATTTNGEVSVPCLRDTPIWLSNSAGSPCTAALRGHTAFLEDDQFVRGSAVGGVSIPVGEILEVSATLGVLCRCDGQTGGLSGASGAYTVDVSSPLYKFPAATDGEIRATAAKNVVVTLGDNAGAKSLAVNSLAGNPLLTVNSLGAVVATTTITGTTGIVATTGNIVASAGSVTAVGAVSDVTAGRDVTAVRNVVATAALAGATAAIAGLADVGKLSLGAASYKEVATGGAPTQAQMTVALGAGANGQIGIFVDTTANVGYLCIYSLHCGGWQYLASTVGA